MDGLDHVEGAVNVCLECWKGIVERLFDEALRCKMVALIRLHIFDKVDNACITLDVRGMEGDLVKEVIYPAIALGHVLCSNPSYCTVDLIPFLEKKLG